MLALQLIACQKVEGTQHPNYSMSLSQEQYVGTIPTLAYISH